MSVRVSMIHLRPCGSVDGCARKRTRGYTRAFDCSCVQVCVFGMGVGLVLDVFLCVT